MLQMFCSGFLFRVAILLAAFAALCFVAPPAVMAFGHGSNTVQCLAHGDTVDHGGHMGAKNKDHSGHAKLPGNHASACCGMFCLSALAPASGPVVEGLLTSPKLTPLVETSFFGQTPDLPHRPPITILAV
jgi:hypothetical protein